MRVNIITQPLFINYGGILQNYALQEVLRRLGHEPQTINVPPKKVRERANWKDYVKTGINFMSKLRGSYSFPFLNPYTLAVKERELSFPQREFVEKYIVKKDVAAPFTHETALENPADLWIVGSDQVWRPWCNLYIENEFFDFLDDDSCRIAYAASFGTDKWEIPEYETPRIKELAKKFKAISVREASGVKLCKDYLDVDAYQTLDPTLLLTGEDYLKLTKESDHPQGEYIASYILDVNRDKIKAVKKFSSKKGLRLYNVGQMHKDRYDTIESWLSTLANAKYVITDSFHGTVFSLLFNRPVNVLSNDLRGNTRLQSIFKLLNLSPDSENLIRLNKRSIDQLEVLREKSLNFLKKSLSNNE